MIGGSKKKPYFNVVLMRTWTKICFAHVILAVRHDIWLNKRFCFTVDEN